MVHIICRLQVLNFISYNIWRILGDLILPLEWKHYQLFLLRFVCPFLFYPVLWRCEEPWICWWRPNLELRATWYYLFFVFIFIYFVVVFDRNIPTSGVSLEPIKLEHVILIVVLIVSWELWVSLLLHVALIIWICQFLLWKTKLIMTFLQVRQAKNLFFYTKLDKKQFAPQACDKKKPHTNYELVTYYTITVLSTKFW